MRIRATSFLAFFAGGLAAYGVWASSGVGVGPYLLLGVVVIVALACDALDAAQESELLAKLATLEKTYAGRLTAHERRLDELERELASWEEVP